MEKNFYIELIYKSFSEPLSSEERHQLDGWLAASAENKKEAKVIQKMWDMSADFSKDIEVDLDKDFAQLQQKMKVEVAPKEAIVKTMPSTQKRSWWKPLSVAAAILLLAGAFFIFSKNNENAIDLAMQTNDEVRELVLADGSKVWLNKNSKIDYPSNMDGDVRKVVLTGEAFFDIAKNPNKPFIIEAEGTQVEVLGTSFEVSAYSDAPTVEVFVKTGKVAFGKRGEQAAETLTKNQKAIYKKDTDTFIGRPSNDLNAISWQNNRLEFDNATLEKVINDFENHFDIQLTLTKKELLNCSFSNILPDVTDKEKSLETLAEVFKMTLIKEGNNSYRLDGGKCTTDN